MKVEICEDDGFRIQCQPVKEALKLDSGRLQVKTKNRVFEIDKANYRVFEKYIVWPLWKKTIIRYFVDNVPSSGMNRDDYIKLREVELTERMLMQYSIARQIQLLFILVVVMAVVFAIILGIVAYRPTHVEVIVPTPSPAETTAVPEQPPVLPPPG